MEGQICVGPASPIDLKRRVSKTIHHKDDPGAKAMSKGNMPVLVGAGQAVSHWTADQGASAAPSYVSLATEAAQTALSGFSQQALAAAIDTIAMVRIFDDSIPNYPYPYGRAENLPRAVAKGIGADPARAIYASTGGQSPQSLVNEMAARIHAGDSAIALITGAEVIGAAKTARRADIKIDLSDETGGQLDDRGMGDMLLSRAEIKHGLVTPAFFYALFENAIAARDGETRSQHRRTMSELFKPFSETAAQNPYAQFGEARSIDFLSEPSKENYPFADPFLKWHMAQDAVNQAAAVLIMSEAKADEFGIPARARVYLHGAGEAADANISERPRLDGSWAMDTAIARALEQAACTPDDLSLLDLYSCFPCAVLSACSALGIDPQTETRSLTLTGGLPFFGGPGNNYSLHAIASMYGACTSKPSAKGLVLANGGWMTKEAAGIYSTDRPGEFVPADPPAKPEHTLSPISGPAEGTIETYTLIRRRGAPAQAIAFVRTVEGDRLIASSHDADLLSQIDREETSIGRHVVLTTEGEVNTLSLV
ncbi:MAG: acetyl-CoA acetyltransferase [Pseudomonadota bacterium]